MPLETALHERRRPLTEGELLAIPWMRLLTQDERERAATDLKVAEADPGETLCRTGRPVTGFITTASEPPWKLPSTLLRWKSSSRPSAVGEL